ncbi:MAG: tetratricopeptide repeat protein [Planctomycetaceae bacterium]
MPTILTRAQRKYLRVLLAVALFVLANSAFLFLAHRQDAMGLFYQLMLIAHVVGGVAVLLLATLFLLWHLRRVRNLLRFPAVSSGVGLTLAAYLLFATGLFLFSEANTRENAWILLAHQLLGILAPALYATHRLVSHFRPARRSALAGGCAFAFLLLVMVGLHAGTLPPPPSQGSPRELALGQDPFLPFRPSNYPDASSPFFPSSVTTDSNRFFPAAVITRDERGDFERIRADVERFGFAANVPIGADTCARCHPDIVAQWETSAHRFASFNNPFYRASVEKFRETRGKEASQWCAGCHDPAIMLAGNMTGEIEPLIPESQAGLTCLACHVIERLHGTVGNGNYHVADEKPSPYLFDTSKSGPFREVADTLIKMRPAVHKAQMKKPFFTKSEFCSACHKVSLDVPVNRYRFVRGQNEFDAWHDSGVSHNAARTFYLPPAARQCQDCHMPREEAPLGDVSAKGGMVRSHRFLAVNTALPYVRGDFDTLRRIEAFLRDEKLRIDLFALERADGSLERALDRARPVLAAGEEVIFEVVVRNLGVGHTFPGGTNDSNEGWIEFQATDADGRVLLHSGAMGSDGRVDPAAHFYRVVMVRHDGTWANERDPHLFHFPAFVRVIGPGSADVARYAVKIPEGGAGGRITARAKLNWRKFNRDYSEFVFLQRKLKVPDLDHLRGQAVPDLPVTVIEEDSVTLEVGAAPARGRGVDDPALWMRFNDHGIASLLQGAFDVAEASFEGVTRLRPDLPDGWRNLARRWIQSGTPQKARPLLEKATALVPDHPQVPYFWGRYYERVEEFAEAERAYLASLRTFPADRDAWRNLGQVRFKLHKYAEALEAYLEVLALDPEDLEAHKRRLDIYRLLGREAEAAEAEKAFEKYQKDDQAEQVALDFLRRHGEINDDAQRRHVHR